MHICRSQQQQQQQQKRKNSSDEAIIARCEFVDRCVRACEVGAGRWFWFGLALTSARSRNGFLAFSARGSCPSRRKPRLGTLKQSQSGVPAHFHLPGLHLDRLQHRLLHCLHVRFDLRPSDHHCTHARMHDSRESRAPDMHPVHHSRNAGY